MCLEVIVRRQHARGNQFFLEYGHEVQQILGMIVAYIVDSVRRHRQTVLPCRSLRSMLHHPHYSFHNVIYKGKVTLAVAVIEYADGLAGAQFVGKAEISHIRTAGRPVDCKETQPRAGNVIQFAVCVGHQFIGFLGGGIQADRIVYLVVRTVRDLLVGAVDT